MATFLSYYYATKPNRQRESYGFIKRHHGLALTFGGMVHLGYFFIQASVASLGILLTVTGNVGTIQLAIGWSGAGLYGIVFLRDLRRGLLTP